MFNEFSFFPDIDLYYDKDLSEAYSLVDSLCKLNITYLKFALCLNNPVSKKYSSLDRWVDPLGKEHSQSLYDTFSQRLLSVDLAVEFLNYCSAKNIELIASVYDFEAANVASKYCKALKISSSNITNIPLLEHVSNNCSNLILDTGKASFTEIERSIELALACNPNLNLLVQYSPTRPPAPHSTWDMQKITEYRERFNIAIGLSDHGDDSRQAIMAVALGVNSVEKGIMSDRAWEEGVSDSAHCLPISRLGDYLDDIYASVNGMIKSSDTKNLDSDRSETRSGLYTTRNIDAGQKIARVDVESLVPEIGISAAEYHNVIGATAQRDIKKGDPLKSDDIGDN